MRGKPFLFISILACMMIFAACAPESFAQPGSGSTNSGSESAQPSATTPPEPPTTTAAPSGTPTTGDFSSVPEVSTTVPGAGVTAVVGTSEPGTSEPLPAQGGGIGPGAFVTPGPDGNLSITLEDQGKTVLLKKGQRFLLNLGEGYIWSPEVADQSVVSRVPNIAVIRGAQGIYEAHQPGKTTLTVNGDPTCRQSKPPCAIASRTFSITIEVQ